MTATVTGFLARRSRPLLAAYALVLAVILLSPSASLQTASVTEVTRVLQWFLPDRLVNGTRVEVLLNAVIIAPVPFLGHLVFPRLRWQDWTAYGFIGAALVELSQGLFLPDRSAAFSDIVANASGALLGAVLAGVLLRSVDRDQASLPAASSAP